MPLLLSESPSKRTIWQKATVEITHMITLSIIACSHHLHMGRKCHKFNAAKQVFRDQSVSFIHAKYFWGHENNPFQLKYIKFLHGHERNICLIEAMFD